MSNIKNVVFWGVTFSRQTVLIYHSDSQQNLKPQNVQHNISVVSNIRKNN